MFVGHCVGACGNSTVWLLWLMCSVSYSRFGEVFFRGKFEDSLLFRLVGGIGGLIRLVPLVMCMGKYKTTFSECMWGRFV